MAPAGCPRRDRPGTHTAGSPTAREWSRPGSSEKLGLVSCPLEHQNETWTRGATSPLGHGACTDARATDGVSSSHCQFSLCREARGRRDRRRDEPDQRHGDGDAVEVRSATDDPPSELDMPPPNMSDRPPPLPLWRRMSRVRNSAENQEDLEADANRVHGQSFVRGLGAQPVQDNRSGEQHRSGSGQVVPRWSRNRQIAANSTGSIDAPRRERRRRPPWP